MTGLHGQAIFKIVDSPPIYDVPRPDDVLEASSGRSDIRELNQPETLSIVAVLCCVACSLSAGVWSNQRTNAKCGQNQRTLQPTQTVSLAAVGAEKGKRSDRTVKVRSGNEDQSGTQLG